MPKTITDNALDAAFTYIASRADQLAVCQGVPVSVAEATTLVNAGGKMLASVALEEGVAGADFALAPGSASGRRLIVASQNDLLIAASGTADHVALVDTEADELLSVTSLSQAQPLSAGSLVLLKSFSKEINAPQ